MSSSRNTQYTVTVDATQSEAAYDSLSAKYKDAAAAAVAGAESTKQALGGLLVVQQQMAAEATVVNTAIKGEVAALNQMRDIAGQSAAMQSQLSGAMADSEVKIQELLLAKQGLADVTAEVNMQVAEFAGTEEVATNSTRTLTTGVRALGAEMRIMGVHGASGARSLTMLLNATSVLNPVMLVSILAFGALAAILAKASQEKQKHVELNDKLIEQDIVKLNSEKDLVLQGGKVQSVNADLDAILVKTIADHKAYTDATLKSKDAEAALAPAIQTVNDLHLQEVVDLHNVTLGTSEYVQFVVKAAEDAKKANLEQTEARQKSQQELDKDIATLRKFADESKMTNEVLLDQAKKLGATTEALKDFESWLNSSTRATEAFQKGLSEMKAATINVAETSEGMTRSAEDLAGAIARDSAAGRTATDIAMGYRSELEKTKKNLEATVDSEVAAGKVKATHSAMQAELNRLIAASPLAPYLVNIEKIDAAHKHWTEHAKDNSKAIQSLTDSIQKQLEVAAAANVDDSATSKQAKIRAEIDAERRKVIEVAGINTAAALALNIELNALLLERLTTATNLELDAESKKNAEIEARLSALNAKNSDNKIAQLRADMDREFQADLEFLEQKKLTDSQFAVLITDFRLAREKRYFEEVEKLSKESAAKQAHGELEIENTLANERLALDRKILQQFVKNAKDLQAARTAIGSQIGGSIVRPADTAEVEKLLKAIKDLGGAYEGVAKDANLVKAALDSVNKMFGFASQNGHILELQLKALQQLGDGDVFGSLKTSLEAMVEEMTTGEQTAKALSDAFQGAFTEMIKNGGSFISAFGKLLLGGMLEILGKMATEVGTYYLLEGLAALWDPFTTVNAGALIAAGTALIAFGAGLSAVGAAVKSSATSTAKSSSSGGAAAAASPNQSIGFGGPLNSPPPSRVPVSSGPPASAISGPQGTGGQSAPITIMVSGSDVKRWLDGQAITYETLQRDRPKIQRTLGIART